MAYFREAINTIRQAGVRPEAVNWLEVVGQCDIAKDLGYVVEDMPRIGDVWFDKGIAAMSHLDLRCHIKLPESILAEAARIRGGERRADYGDAVENFSRITAIANAATGLQLTSAQVCKVMLAVKLARELHHHKRDNLVDLCGYADILNLIEEDKLNNDKSQ